jgi:hypothetical protein
MAAVGATLVVARNDNGNRNDNGPKNDIDIRNNNPKKIS